MPPNNTDGGLRHRVDATAPPSSAPAPSFFSIDQKKGATTEKLRLSPYTDMFWLPRLFGGSHALLHRVMGLLYLLMYVSAWHAYTTDYEGTFLRSPLLWALPLLGLLQSLSATYFFYSILPKGSDPGYYSDNSTLSGNFVAENIFYAGLLLFQFLYVNPSPKGTPLTAGVPFWGAGIPGADWLALGAEGGLGAFASRYAARVPLLVAELVFVFLPYQVLRPFVPKTSMRDSMKSDTNVTEKNRLFYVIGIRVTKVFYSWAKWFIGIGANYLVFAGLVTSPTHVKEWYGLLLCSAFATTISMFLHTLRFKGYIGPKTSFSLYVASYLATFVYIVRVGDMFLGPRAVPILLLPTIGVLLNFVAPRAVQNAWQYLSLAALVSARLGLVELPAAW
jgi:hypothetical protein